MANAAAPDRVYVRMYRGLTPGLNAKGWLGDCFLIRIERGGKWSHILIDCGILTGSEASGVRMAQVTDDIVATTGGKLDLLVVTHEHWDHISGFSEAQDVFFGVDGAKPRLDIAEIWMAWTEKRGDKLADDLDEGLGKRSEAFVKLQQRLKTDPPFGADAASALGGLEAFIGPAEDGALALGGKRLTGRAIMEKLKGSWPTTYREPGETLDTPTKVAPLRAHVFGPPRTAERLFKDSPSSGEARETYGPDHGQGMALAAAAFNESRVVAFADGQGDGPGEDSPFARRYCKILSTVVDPKGDGDALIDDGDAETYKWLRDRYYGATGDDDGDNPFDRRRIDGEWLAVAGPLALKLDSDTNNTSLVLAFELPDGTNMLFAADAQVGNWLSWHDQDYDAGGGKRVTAAELLGRTVLYKVGHHGSHNATLRAQGLEMMTHPDLVALIPTDEEFGLTRPGDWKMPNKDVNTALVTRTKGRIVRNDRDFAAADRDRLFGDRLTQTPVFSEYRVFGPA